jgi:hypothetical protein
MFIAVLVLSLLLWAVRHNWFPPTDRGSFIFSLESDVMLATTTALIKSKLGRKPRFDASSSYAKRMMYGDGVILNSPSPEALENAGGRMAAWGHVVENPVSVAHYVEGFLTGHAEEIRVIHNPDSSLPDGAMSWVTWKGCPFVLILRKRFDKMGPMPPRYEA